MRHFCCLASLFILASCSVKENRSACPCELTVLPYEPLKTAGSVLVSVVQDGEVVRQGMLDGDAFEAGECRLQVQRRLSQVTVFTGITAMNALRGKMLDIAGEKQCDEVYSCSCTAELAGDEFLVPVKLHKNFARLTLSVLNQPEDTYLCVKGSVGGYNLLDAVPYEGDFNCYTDSTEDQGQWSIRLPRQLDDDLSLDVMSGEEIKRTVPLGELILSTGYSFQDEDLLDISMTIDLNKSYALLSVEGWDDITLPIS